MRLSGGCPLSSHSFRKCSSVPRQPNYENPWHFRNDIAQLLQMGVREFKFVLRFYRQCDCRIRIVTFGYSRVPRGQKVLTREEDKLLTFAYQRLFNLTLSCCF